MANMNQGRGQLSMLLGQSGVYAVASQLCLHGHVPMFPAIDCGVDLMIENGLRLQVKAAHLTYPNSGIYAKRPNFGVRGGTVRGNYLGGAYGFSVRRGEWKGAEAIYRKDKKGYSDVADFFVLWGIDENRFWIVPTSIKNRTIWFGKVSHPNNSNNFSHTNKLKEDRIAQYENRWDLLDMNAAVETLIEGAAETVVHKET